MEFTEDLGNTGMQVPCTPFAQTCTPCTIVNSRRTILHCVILETLYETVHLVHICTPGTTKLNTRDLED
jgi:hypothetical protein